MANTRRTLALVALLTAMASTTAAAGQSADSSAVVYADIGLAFFNRFNDAPGQPATDCFQRYHVGTIGAAGDLWDVRLAYHWHDAVTSATSFHALTPYSLSAGLWASERLRVEAEAALVRDIVNDRDLCTLLGLSLRYRTAGQVHMEALAGLRFVSTGDSEALKAVPGGSVMLAVGQSSLELSLDSLPAVDYALLGVNRHVASLRANLPAWGGKAVSLGVSRVVGGDVLDVPGRVWFDVRLDLGHIAAVALGGR